MQHSDKYDTVRRYYGMGLWNEERVKNAVIKNWITKEEFKEIVGSDYE